VDVFVIFAAGVGGDLSGVTIRRADEKSAADLARELDERAAAARSGEGELDRAKGMMSATPYFLLRPFLRLSAFLTSDLNMSLKRLGMPRQAFGEAMVTNVGVFGIQEGWAPLSPIYRMPILVLAGEITTRAWAVDGSVEPRPVPPDNGDDRPSLGGRLRDRGSGRVVPEIPGEPLGPGNLNPGGPQTAFLVAMSSDGGSSPAGGGEPRCSWSATGWSDNRQTCSISAPSEDARTSTT
jgi:hypothetical protein